MGISKCPRPECRPLIGMRTHSCWSDPHKLGVLHQRCDQDALSPGLDPLHHFLSGCFGEPSRSPFKVTEGWAVNHCRPGFHISLIIHFFRTHHDIPSVPAFLSVLLSNLCLANQPPLPYQSPSDQDHWPSHHSVLLNALQSAPDRTPALSSSTDRECPGRNGTDQK